MGAFSEAVQWWEEWQLRVLVLTSLFLQCFLFFAGILRKRCIPPWLRFLIWLAYLSSDAVAIYGLATLFNRQKSQEWVSRHQSSARLQVLWAPILLIHLGGQNGITAYNIEDNELWRRHVLTAASQVAVAVYAFRRSWPEDERILITGVPLFAVGFLKCALKPWDLMRVSINSLVDSSAGSEENGNVSSAGSEGNGNVSSLDEYIGAATKYFWEGPPGPSASGVGSEVKTRKWMPYDLFIDLSPPYLYRLHFLKCVVHGPADRAHRLVRSGLSVTFDRLYTKESLLLMFPSSNTKLLGWFAFLRFVVTAESLIVVLCGFRLSHKEAYDDTDVTITLILLFLAVALDLLPALMHRNKNFRHLGNGRWPDEVAQYNLMGYLIRNQKHRKLRKLLFCKDYIDQLWCMKPSKSSSNIINLVHRYIANGWMDHHIKDMATYRAFNDNRGQWTLKQEGCNHSLDWGLRRPFDESVLIWHLATDFCFIHMDPSPAHEAAYEAARRSKEISNYMVYLLFVNPEMLMTGARRSLFRAMYNKLKDIPLYNDEPVPQGEKELAENIIHRIMATDQASGMVHDAWAIAYELSTCFQRDEEKIWRVVQGVWVEMLCFSAGRCRGYLHAKSLGKGGELLSYIWLLLFYMGMETVAEKMQRSETDGDSVVDTNSASQVTATEEIMFDKRRGAYDDISILTS